MTQISDKEIVQKEHPEANCVKVTDSAYYICMFEKYPFFEPHIGFSKVSEEEAWRNAAHNATQYSIV
jgi:hypothetical protein